MSAAYDNFATDYDDFVQQGLQDKTSVLATATQSILDLLNQDIHSDICDLCCGQGHLSETVARQAQSVVGIDISSELIQLASAKIKRSNLRFVVDDAQILASQVPESFDSVISNLALMDIPNIEAVYGSVLRILRPSGRFIFSITHPCFQSPKASIQTNSDGAFLSQQLHTYATEGFWWSDNPHGIRGKVGAHHRTISTYLNLAVSTGFTIHHLLEPTLPSVKYDSAHKIAQIEMPSIMVIVLVK